MMQAWLVVLCLTWLGFQAAERPFYIRSRPNTHYHVLGGIVYRGQINDAGDFVPAEDFKPRPLRTLVVSASSQSFLRSGKPKEPVYEYRCGRLIPGILEKEAFVPDLDGKVIEFKTYRWSPTARRIYNLPGRFVTKLDYEHLRASKELTEDDLEFNKDR